MMRTAFYNANVYTADRDRPKTESFAVEDGRFCFVGSAAELPECDERIDLGGACVIPGLIDSHCHMFAGIMQTVADMLFVKQTVRPENLGETLKSLLEESPTPDGKTITAMGIDLTVGDFSAVNIDCVFPDRPVQVFSFDGHALLLNTKAMERLGLNRDTPDPSENSYYVRNDRGDPTGLVIEIEAMRPCKALIKAPTPEECYQALVQLAGAYSALGYTGLFEAMSFDDGNEDVLKALQKLDSEGGLPLRVSTSFGYSGEELLPIREVMSLMKRNRQQYNSGNVRHETLKMITDGTVEEHSALLWEPYADQPENSGSENLTPEELCRAAKLAAEEGYSVHIHAIGDKAVTRALDALCGLRCAGTKTIAHNQLYKETDIRRMLDAGDIFFQTTPHWAVNDGYTLGYLGQERYGRQFRIGTMVRGGACVTFGSDSCLEPDTADPFLGMFYACTRGNGELCSEECLGPESETIGRLEALEAYTVNCARQMGLETETGSIVSGKSADFVITDRDVIGCPLGELREAKAVQTWFRGNRVV